MNKYHIIFVILFFSCQAKKDEHQIEYYKDGFVKSILNYKNSELNSQCFWFYPNGKLQQLVDFENGKANGNAYYYYPSGTKQFYRHWVNDTLDGYSDDYFDNIIGTVKNILLYKNGKLIYRKELDSLGNVIKVEGRQY